MYPGMPRAGGLFKSAANTLPTLPVLRKGAPPFSSCESLKYFQQEIVSTRNLYPQSALPSQRRFREPLFIPGTKRGSASKSNARSCTLTSDRGRGIIVSLSIGGLVKRSSGPRKTSSLSESVQQHFNEHAVEAIATGVGVVSFWRPKESKCAVQ